MPSEQNPDPNQHTKLRQRIKEKVKEKAIIETTRAKEIYQELHEEHQIEGHRWLGYVAALARQIKLMIRYAAYSSDIGEAFRPVVHVNVVRGAYAMSWVYVIGDVSYETYDKYTRLDFRGWDLFHVATKRAVFQTTASMALPAFTIHSAVHYSKKYIFQKRLPQYLRWGPTSCGLAVVPFLPFMFDEPVEVATELLWEHMLPLTPSSRAKIHKDEHDAKMAQEDNEG